jgi:hypothetical protein
MVARCNRARPVSSLEERLLKFAEEARAAAALITPGPERDSLLKRALQAETRASAAESLG